MHGARLHKTSRRNAMARDQRGDLLRQDGNILLRNRDEIRDASVQGRNETKTLRILFETRPRRDVSAFRDRLETETSWPRSHLWLPVFKVSCSVLRFLVILQNLTLNIHWKPVSRLLLTRWIRRQKKSRLQAKILTKIRRMTILRNQNL